MEKKMVYYSALHWAKKAEKSAEKCEQIQEDLRDSGLDLSDYAKKGEVVHNTGDETIDGVKTFNNEVYFNSAVAFVKNTTNTQNTYQDINSVRDNTLVTGGIPYNKTYYTNALKDKNNKFVTYIENTHKADGTSIMSINARTQNANGENVTSYIGVEATKNGDVVATAPLPAASNSKDSKQISTVGWVNDPSASLNVVHRTGDETIDGIKKFTNIPYLSIGGFREIIDIDKGTAPTSGIYAFDSIFYDKNGTLQKHKIAQKYAYIQKNGAVANITSVFKPEAGSEEAVSMGIGYNEKGEGYSTTVMPVASSSTTATNIATTGWVNDPSASLNVVHRTGDETIDGIKAFKQGIKGTFENYYAYNGATNDKPWKKVMEITLSGTYNTINIPFMMNNTLSAKFGWGSGTINLSNVNVAGTLNSATSGIHFNILPNWCVHYDYKLLYKNNYPETGKILIEFWVKISSTYAGVCFTILDMLTGGIGKFDRSKITWYNNTQQYAELPTGYNEISYTLNTMQTNTPETGSNSKEIATTEWVNSFLSSIVNTSTKDSGYVKINGLIIQWGIEEKGADKNVTFPTPFTTTNYTVTMNTCEGSGEQYARGARNRTTTGFQMYAGGGATTHSFSWMAVGY